MNIASHGPNTPKGIQKASSPFQANGPVRTLKAIAPASPIKVNHTVK